MTNSNPTVYAPKHPESYCLARLVFGAALRFDDHDATAIVARKVAGALARDLDRGLLNVDQRGDPLEDAAPEKVVRLLLLAGEGTVPGVGLDGKPAQVQAPAVITVVDRDARVVSVPAPRYLLNERATVPLELHTGAARLSVALAAGPLGDREREAVVMFAGALLGRHATQAADSCRATLARAIDEVRLLAREAGWSENEAPNAPTEAPTLRARIVREIQAGGPLLAPTALEAQRAPDAGVFARRLLVESPAVFAGVFSAELRAAIESA